MPKKEKKDFTASTQEVFETIESATEDETEQDFPDKKISMTLSGANYDYLRSISIGSGETMTQTINKILDKSREENAELYEQILAFRKSLK